MNDFLEITHGERRARVYNGGLGSELPAGSRDRAPGQVVRRRSPWSWKHFSLAKVQMRRKFVHFALYCKPVKFMLFKRILWRFCRLNTEWQTYFVFETAQLLETCFRFS